MSTPSFPAPMTKPWGNTRCIMRDETHEVWHASILEGGYSSRHYHERKINEFYVVSGRLLVHVWDDPNDEAPKMTHVVVAGQRLCIDDHVWHGFEALTDVELLEIYHAHLKGEDIVRHDTGGLKTA